MEHGWFRTTLIGRTADGRSARARIAFKGDPGNQRDGLYRSVGDLNAQALVTVDFSPIEGSRIGELAARFDIVPGFTPED